MDRSPVPRVATLTLVAGVAGVAVTLVAGCGPARHPGPAASRSDTASPTSPSPTAPSLAATPAVTSTAGIGNPDGYPRDAEAYAQAAIDAWVAGQTSRIAQLTTADVAGAFASISGHPDPHWQVASADGAAGSTYLTFRNRDGDELRVRVVNQDLGQSHAVAEVIFKRTG